MKKARERSGRVNALLAIAVTSMGVAALAGGCGDSGDTSSGAGAASSTGTTGGGGTSSSSSKASSSSSSKASSSSSKASSGATGGMGGTGGTGGMATSTGGTGATGGSDAGPQACTTAAAGATRGSAIALSPDESRLVSVNRDAGTVSVIGVDYSGGIPALALISELAVGAEPWQAVIDGCGTKAYVVLRKDQKVVEIDGIDTMTPTVGASVAVGSEPTGLALTPNNTKLYVANWVDGTVSVLDPASLTVTSTIDLNATLAATGLLGAGVTSRPALAHPRAISITNNGDANDADETVVVTEWFAQRTAPEAADGSNSDTNKKGLVYVFNVGTGAVSTVDLPPIADTGFNDHNNKKTGCFPNQVASVTVDGTFAYVTSTCASPVGPIGVFQKGACASNADCTAVGSTCSSGACTLTCAQDSDCGAAAPKGTCSLPAGTCAPLAIDVKTTTHPAVSIVDLTGMTATTTNLDALFAAKMTTRFPLLPTDIGFHGGFAYLSSEGSDAVYRLTITNGTISDVGSAANNFINMRTGASDTEIRLPIGVAVSEKQAFAFVSDDGTRDVTALDLSAQAIAVTSGQTDFRIVQASPLPAMGTAADDQRRGKRFFNTGLGRWSLNGAAWGSCGACHIDGLSDGVTWYFARGPRQTVSLEGTFNSNDPTDVRIMNWTGINDEVADFEGNIRGISGGVGALVTTVSSPPAVTDRINTATETPPQQGLQGSSDDAANPAGSSAHQHTVITDWQKITAYIQSIRSPRAPTNLNASDVAAGQALFNVGQGNCVGCHSGGKWTISKRFYSPGDGPNAATADMSATSLSKVSWNANLNGFPAALFPSSVMGSQTMRFGNPPGAEQLQCILRPVGTIKPPMAGMSVPIGVSPADVNVVELRQDMVTGAQGAAATGNGFNPPSLLGMSVGAPYFHAGNARTLEEAFSATFQAHFQTPISSVFSPNATQIQQLVAFLLSIDESTTPFTEPMLGTGGGDLCHYP